jgi:purine-binding chemotaxis protein CheW
MYKKDFSEGPPLTAPPTGTSGATEDELQVETPEATIDLLCFQLGPEIYAFHMGDVQEIAHPPAITPVPGTPSYVKGLSSLRGKMVPIMDLKVKLTIIEIEKIPDTDKKRSRVTQRAKIIIVRGPKGPIGIMADRIIGVRRVPGAALTPTPPHITGEEARLIEGIIISEKMLMTVLRTEEALGLTITRKAHPEDNQ